MQVLKEWTYTPCIFFLSFIRVLLTKLNPFPSFLVGPQKKEEALATPVVGAATPFIAWIGPPTLTQRVLRGQVKSQRRSTNPLHKEQVRREKPCHNLN